MKSYPESIIQKIEALEKKYAEMGQDMPAYLDGLLYSNILTYWDYIHLDTLLSIQKPKTDCNDEMIFITYHQITELMFHLIISEAEQLCADKDKPQEIWIKHLSRINRYYRHLISSFDIMIQGMDKDAFRKFRMALLPASGFQSVQYRKIEIYSSSLWQLLHISHRNIFKEDTSLNTLYQHIYWKSSNIELKSGKKTLTLTMFEEKYDEVLLALAKSLETQNINHKYLQAHTEIKNNPEIIKELKNFDLNANLFWPLAHYGAADAFLRDKHEVIVATGGTNWQTYLPPHHQKIMYFPSLWSEQEGANWGKVK